MVTIGIIGFGSFGRLAAKHLKDRADILVSDTKDRSKDANKAGLKFASMAETCNCNVVIIAVPMECFERTVESIKPLLRPGTLVLDVCSLKMFSCDAMKRALPKNIEIIGTHPLFGPQSAKGGIKDLKIVLCNVSAKKETLRRVILFCKQLGLRTIITTPKDHDKQMAVAQALAHFIARVGKNMGLKRLTLSTMTYDRLMDAVILVKDDSDALFRNIQTMNPYADEIRERFLREANRIDNSLKIKKN